MASDISRKLLNPKKHYSGVVMQQGRVQLDSDWNEQLDLQMYRTHLQTKDVIGTNGVPKKGNSFKITPIPNGMSIEKGHMYVGGLLCKLDETVTYLNQPYYPNPVNPFIGIGSPPDSPPNSPPSQTMEGTCVIYIDAWQREINYLDDPLTQEVALGEADTSTRLQNVWQVKILKTDINDADCKTDIPEWNHLTAPVTGTLNVQAKKLTGTDDPCILAPDIGYRRLENQLYRIEVQHGGDETTATFKWSRDNASVETKIIEVSGSTLLVEEVGKDEILGFSASNWVEFVDEESNLKGAPYPLVQIQSVDVSRREITLASAPPVSTGHLKLRRWDQKGASATAAGVAITSGWIDLEGGIQIEFSSGTYKAGDYWLVPARTATGDVEWPPYKIPNTNPIPQAPAGVQHHYCKLAIVYIENGSIIQVEDCRPLFPALTEICAEDICYDDGNCDHLQAENVQQALDLLCAANDLRLHHKLLHGYGVICGMKLKCGPDRQSVLVASGYALDCEGNIIQIKKGPKVFSLIAEAAKKGIYQPGGDGEFCLSISGYGANGPKIDVEVYQKKSFWEEILEGGIWQKFYEECIQDLIIFLQDQLSFSMSDTPPVTLKQRRITALLNLFIQILNGSTGRYIFLSGERDPGRKDQTCGAGSNESHSEDKLLWCFYNALKNKIASETFCAMFDDDTPFPDYNLDPGLDTIFGPPLKMHIKLKVGPSGKYAFTVGLNGNIYVYELEKKEFIHAVAFPVPSNVEIMDIALDKEGKILYAVGLIDSKDTVFALGDIANNGNISWRPNSVKCAIKYVRLAVGSAGQLYAIGKSQGLYEIVGLGTNSFSQNQIRAFNATGLLTLSTDGQSAFAASHSSPVGTESSSFVNILNINLATKTINNTYPFTGNDMENDIICYKDTLYATGENASGNRELGHLRIGTATNFTTLQLDNNSEAIRMAVMSDHNLGDYVLLSLSNLYKVVRVSIPANAADPHILDTNFRIPVQMFPAGIAINPQTNRAYVLNAIVNTLTEINIPMAFHNVPAPDYTMEPPQNLADYRDQVIKAYSDLLGHLLNHLKDCFCDQYLIDCPECGPEDKIYLGVVEVRKGQVYHICNFTKRKYVKSFSTYGHWLSTVPILPIVKKAFAEFCCQVINP